MRFTKVHLKMALPSAFVLLISITGLLIITLNYYISAGSLRHVARNYIDEVSRHTLEKTLGHLQPAAQMAQMNAVLLSPDDSPTQYIQTFTDVTMNELGRFPQFALLYFGDEHGNFFNNARDLDGAIRTQYVQRLDDSAESREALKQALAMPRVTKEENEAVAAMLRPYMQTLWWIRDRQTEIVREEVMHSYPYDPRLRPWYQKAKETAQVRWTDPYVFSSSGRLYASGKPGITVSAPVYQHNQFVGAVGVDIVLEEISAFLADLKIGRTGRAFIIDPEGRTIGLSKYDQLTVKREDGGLALNHIENIDDTAAVESFRQLQTRLNSCPYETVDFEQMQELEKSGDNLFQFKSGGVHYFGFYIPFPQGFGLNWFVGIVVPEDDFLGEVRRNIYVGAAVSLAFLLVVVFFAINLTKRVTGPINRVAKAAERIKNFELDGRIEVRSLFTEIDDLAASVRNMQAGLKSFGRYVPTDVVRYLIRSGQEARLGGRSGEVSIFFSDIANFTNIAESMNEHELVLHLGEYLGEMSRIILNRKGTVDKYIGDAIMAFWNAPQKVKDHSVQACLAALECQRVYEDLCRKWLECGLPVLRSRIGINSGRVVVGNMGTEERLNYTVLGDDVNVASRLESLGKQYGVWIIIGPNTQAQAGHVVETRHLDRVAVKGKTTGLDIFELIGEKGKVDQPTVDFITLYEMALQAYFQRQWDTAYTLFANAQKIRPDDTAARLFLKRCQNYKSEPPPPDWDGTFVMTKK